MLIEEGVPIRTGPDVWGTVYYLDPKDGAWTLSTGKAHIPEGWYVVPPSYVVEPHP